MWMFWILAAALAAGAACLVIARAAAAARGAAAPQEDPALPVYRRQLAELDTLAGRGLLDEAALAAARAEAGRRLLSAAQAGARPERMGDRRARLGVVAAVIIAALAAFLLYLKVGSPGLKDQPYSVRLAGWQGADLQTLGPGPLAAVMRTLAASKPNDPKVFDYLGRAELNAGDADAAARAFQRSLKLSPSQPAVYAALGQALFLGNGGVVTADAKAAFDRALKLDPKNPAARYFLGRGDIAQGKTAEGLAMWRALEADLPPDDANRGALQSEIQAVQSGGSPQSAQAPSPDTQRPDLRRMDPAQQSFIRAMVQKQAADLKAHPDNPAGWARLVRSYGVLGDKAAQAQALAQARALYAKRPDLLAPIEGEARPRSDE